MVLKIWASTPQTDPGTHRKDFPRITLSPMTMVGGSLIEIDIKGPGSWNREVEIDFLKDRGGDHGFKVKFLDARIWMEIRSCRDSRSRGHRFCEGY